MRRSSGGGTTFILGAGASLHAGYPFIASMGTKLFAWMRKPRKALGYNFASCADDLEERFGNNIESVLNGIDTEIRRGGPDRGAFANVHKPALVEALRQWFADIHRRKRASAYERFAGKIVQPGDHIISFNYDVGLDACLRAVGKWHVGDGYGFAATELPSGSVVRLLKLHGSINWFAILFQGRTGFFAAALEGAFGDRPAFCDNDLTALGYTGVIDPLFPRTGSAAILPLILPTNKKKFYFATNLGREWTAFWDRLWRKARRAIRESDRIVVLGYGMQPIDTRGCNLLLRGPLKGKIEVCSGSQSTRIVKVLRANGRTARVAKHVYFEDWVSAHT